MPFHGKVTASVDFRTHSICVAQRKRETLRLNDILYFVCSLFGFTLLVACMVTILPGVCVFARVVILCYIKATTMWTETESLKPKSIGKVKFVYEKPTEAKWFDRKVSWCDWGPNELFCFPLVGCHHCRFETRKPFRHAEHQKRTIHRDTETEPEPERNCK